MALPACVAWEAASAAVRLCTTFILVPPVVLNLFMNSWSCVYTVLMYTPHDSHHFLNVYLQS